MNASTPPPGGDRDVPLARRLGWFALLYAGGVLAVVAVAAVFRVLVLNAVR